MDGCHHPSTRDALTLSPFACTWGTEDLAYKGILPLPVWPPISSVDGSPTAKHRMLGTRGRQLFPELRGMGDV